MFQHNRVKEAMRGGLKQDSRRSDRFGCATIEGEGRDVVVWGLEAERPHTFVCHGPKKSASSLRVKQVANAVVAQQQNRKLLNLSSKYVVIDQETLNALKDRLQALEAKVASQQAPAKPGEEFPNEFIEQIDELAREIFGEKVRVAEEIDEFSVTQSSRLVVKVIVNTNVDCSPLMSIWYQRLSEFFPSLMPGSVVLDLEVQDAG